MNVSFYFAISEKSDTFAFPIGRPVLPVPLSVLIRQPLHTGPSGPCQAKLPRRQRKAHPPARMAESVDALVSNTSGAIRAGSIPAPGTNQIANL